MILFPIGSRDKDIGQLQRRANRLGTWRLQHARVRGLRQNAIRAPVRCSHADRLRCSGASTQIDETRNKRTPHALRKEAQMRGARRKQAGQRWRQSALGTESDRYERRTGRGTLRPPNWPAERAGVPTSLAAAGATPRGESTSARWASTPRRRPGRQDKAGCAAKPPRSPPPAPLEYPLVHSGLQVRTAAGELSARHEARRRSSVDTATEARLAEVGDAAGALALV